MSLREEIVSMGRNARAASRKLAILSSRRKNAILQAMADELEARRDQILEANRQDMEAGRSVGLSSAMLDRLELTASRIDSMIRGIRNVTALKDPVGSKISRWIRPNGLEIVKVRVPIGVISIIYESRPNVTADAAVLCIKAGNSVILRGGSEAIHSNLAIADALQAGGIRQGLPEHAVQIVRSTDREAVRELCHLDEYLDLIIPRGGEGLIRFITANSRVPVIKHYKGVCHVYVDESADLEMAIRICENAKCQRPGVCNAMETLLVHEKIAEQFLPRMADMFRRHNVELRGDERSRR